MADESPAPVSPPAPTAPESPAPRAPTRLLRVLGALVVVLALAALGGVLWLPSWLQAQIARHGSDALGRAVAVERVELHPFALALTLHGLSVAGPPGPDQPPLLTVSRLHADLDLRSLLRLAPVLQALQIEQPRVQVSRLGEGLWDFDDLLRRLAERARRSPPDAEPARFALYNVQLLDGQLVVDDRPVKGRHTITGLRIELPFLSNLPDHLQVHVEPRVAFVADGAAFDVRGRSLPFTRDRASELTLQLKALQLSRFWPYLPAGLPLSPSGGVLDAQLTLRFAQPPRQPAQVQLRGQVGLKDFALQQGRQQLLAGWRTLDVELLDVQPLRRQVGLGLVRVDGAQVRLDRDSGGQLVLPRRDTAAAATEPTGVAPPGAADAAPWQLSVERTELHDAAIAWRDASVRPAADVGLQGLTLQAGRLVWPLAGDALVTASAQLHAQSRPAGTVQAQARLVGAAGALQLGVEGFPLAALAPYLQTALQPALAGRLQARAELRWSDADAPALQLDVPLLRVQGLQLQEPQAPAGEPALQVRVVQLDDVRVDIDKRQVRLGALTLSRPQLLLRRSTEGRLNVQQWLRTDTAPTPETVAAPAPSWQFEGRELKLDGGRIAWQDMAVRAGPDRHDVHLQALQVRLSQLRWPATNQPMPVRASAELATGTGAQQASAGRVELNGASSLAPLGWRGNLVLERVASELFEPYVAALLPLRLQHAEFGWRGELQATQDANGLRLDARGDAVVTDLDLRSRPRDDAPAATADSQLLAWQALQLRPLVVALAPGTRPRIEVGELRLADFFARLVVTEQGRFNLSDLQTPPAIPGPVATATPAAATAPAPAAAASGPPATTPLPVDLLIGRTELQRGRVDFTDRFVRPNYSAALSELGGSIGRLASGTREMAPVELRGKVAGTGLLDIRGSVNPTASPLALDLQARATDLELAPLSPYSGKYAGYAIERGKLSVDVAYKVDADGRLEARNQIILNQLTFGDKVDSPDATQLPVRFALSLLADRNGVIDIDLPITGSINDPQFSVFGIVLKLIGNLIVKAVTAPFTLLFGAGGGEETSVLEFEPGSARPLPAAMASLDRVAKALGDRPALRLTVAGSADASETDALRAERLRQALLDELRRERARSGTATATATAVPPATGSPEYLALLRRLYVQTPLPDKPRNVVGMLRELPAAEMESRLRAALPIPADSWRELALQRSLAVRDALVARGLASDRLFIGAPRVRTEGEASWTPRASLALGGG